MKFHFVARYSFLSAKDKNKSVNVDSSISVKEKDVASVCEREAEGLLLELN